MKIPNVKTIMGMDELIEVFGDPKKTADRLKEWKAVEDGINAKLETMRKIMNIEVEETRTKALTNEAAAKKSEAEALLTDARKEVGEMKKEAASGINDIKAELSVERANLGQQHTKLNQFRIDLESKEADLLEKQGKADAMRIEAERQILEAKEMKGKYDKMGARLAETFAKG